MYASRLRLDISGPEKLQSSRVCNKARGGSGRDGLGFGSCRCSWLLLRSCFLLALSVAIKKKSINQEFVYYLCFTAFKEVHKTLVVKLRFLRMRQLRRNRTRGDSVACGSPAAYQTRERSQLEDPPPGKQDNVNCDHIRLGSQTCLR
jgi:hypothetical protein